MNTIDRMNKADNQNIIIESVKKAMKDTSSKRMYQRYRVIYLHLKGHTNRDIANIEGFNEQTVGIYVRKFKENGLEGLALKHSPGAPRLLTPEQEALLAEVITSKTPDQVGFSNRKNWYINIVQCWIRENFGVEYSHRGTAEVMYRLKLSFTRPTYTLAKADPKKQEEFKQEFELLKKSH